MSKQHQPSRAGLRAVLTSIFVAIAAASGPACGGSSANLPTVATPPPDAVRALTFLFVPAEAKTRSVQATNESIHSALISAEYKITEDPNEPHDASIIVSASATEQQSFMQVEVNGKRQINYLIRVNVTVKAGGKIADQRTSQIEVTGDDVPPGGGLAIVNDLTDSMRFRQWARKTNEKRNAASKPDDSASPAASSSGSPAAGPSATPSAGPSDDAPPANDEQF